MPLFIWYNKYSVNIEEFDNHHKKLFNIFNRLYDICMHTEYNICIEPILDALLLNADYYFCDEEEYMVKIRFKEIAKHTQMHLHFIERVNEIKEVPDKNDYNIVKELLEYLANWLCIHVTEEDKKYAV